MIYPISSLVLREFTVICSISQLVLREYHCDSPNFVERTNALVFLIVSTRDVEDAILFGEKFSVKTDDDRRTILHAVLRVCL